MFDELSFFRLTLEEPQPLSVSAEIRTLSNEVELALSGAEQYVIELNGKTIRTSEKSLRLPLDQPSNRLRVRTDLDCQGIFEETLVLSDLPLVYPNPVGDEILTVYLAADNAAKVELTLYDLGGARLYAKDSPVTDSQTGLDMSGYPNGVYILNVRTAGELRIYKILKK